MNVLFRLGPVGFALAGMLSAAPPTNGPPEQWLTNEVSHPHTASTQAPDVARFEQLRAEFLADTFALRWFPSSSDKATNVTIRVSVDEPGHWPARDWRAYPMERRGTYWEAPVPVDTLEVPIIYFIETGESASPARSPMRLCWPKLLGLEIPTRLFWPFLEGFEEGMESWRWLAGAPGGGFRTSSAARNGKASLAVTIQPGKTSATLGTTRLRGWRVMEHGATGVSLWLRASSQPGQLRVALLAHAFTDRQTIAARAQPVSIAARWERSDLPFASFGPVPLADLDFMTLEFIGPPGAEFLLDDLQLLGPWVLN